MCVCVLAETSNTMLNTNGENEYSYLYPDLMGKEFSLSPLTTLSVVLS